MCDNLCTYDTSQKDVDISTDVMANESQVIAKIAKEAARNAIRDTFRLGNPIMILEDGYIVKKYPDGRTETVKKIEKMPVISGKRIYHL